MVTFVTTFGTFSLASDHGWRKSWDEPLPLIGVVVAVESKGMEFVSRIAGQKPLRAIRVGVVLLGERATPPIIF